MASSMANTNEMSSSGDSNSWSVLWKLNFPPKIRVFCWRVMHNSLPSKFELKRRHVAKESHCEMCGDAAESLYHVFFSFPVVKRLWAEVKRLTRMRVLNLHHIPAHGQQMFYNRVYVLLQELSC